MDTLECFHALLEQSRTLSILPRGPIWKEEEEEEEEKEKEKRAERRKEC